MRIHACIAATFAAVAVSLSAISASAATLSVTVDDPNSLFTGFHETIRDHAEASMDRWLSHMTLNPSQNPTIDLVVKFSDQIATGNGGSATSSFVATRNGINIFEQGMAAELKTGNDPNGAASPDVVFTISHNWMNNVLWFDPDPFTRTAMVPNNRVDANFFFMHEFGHALAFNGWRDLFDGDLPGDYQSTFDEHVTFDGENFFFTGPNAVTAYGSPVPLTYGNIFHVGNNSPRPGSDLIPDMMNGIVSMFGTRYEVSQVDLAIMRDAGLPTNLAPVPEPSTIALLLIGIAVLGGYRWRQKQAAA